MNSLTLSDLALGLADLLDKRASALAGLHSASLYLPQLSAQRESLAALPEALLSAPLAAELAATDRRHAGYGGCLWHATESALRSPDSSDEVRAAAQRIREAFIPSLDELNASYAVESSTAKQRKGRLSERKSDLKLFPVPGGKTLYTVAKRFLDAGLALDATLSSRADKKGQHAGRAKAGALRGTILGLLGRFRSALRDEVADSPRQKLALDAFGYLDQLDAAHAPAASKKKSDKKKGGKKAADAATKPVDAPSKG